MSPDTKMEVMCSVQKSVEKTVEIKGVSMMIVLITFSYAEPVLRGAEL